MILSIGIVLIGHGIMDIGAIIHTIGVAGVAIHTLTITHLFIISSLLLLLIIRLCAQVAVETRLCRVVTRVAHQQVLVR